MEKLLELLEQDCTMTVDQMAAATGIPLEEAKAAIQQYEKDRVILGYKAIVDWDQLRRENVTALIEVNVVPQSKAGFDRIAERIYQYDEVESMYLMSGTYDMTVMISGRTLREVAEFVSNRLAPIEGVTGTSTHFILKRYKEQHLAFQKRKNKEERFVFE